MTKQVNDSRRTQLKDIGRAILALAAITMAPKLGNAGTLSFGPKGSSTKSLIMDASGNVGIKKTPGTGPDSSALALDVDGNISATKVFNAVWNDLAEFRTVKAGEEKIPGKVYVATEDGLVLASKKAQQGTIGVYSDTYGYALGGKESKNMIPIGISGWVLAYVDKKYPIGTALVSGPNGILTKASCCDKVFNPERIVGIIETSPSSYNNLKIDGRYWVKVK